MFFKISFLKNLAKFTGKHLRWSLYLMKLQTFRFVTLLKRYSNTDVFHWKLRNFPEHHIFQNTSGGCFCFFWSVTKSRHWSKGMFVYRSGELSSFVLLKTNFLFQKITMRIFIILTEPWGFSGNLRQHMGLMKVKA